MHSTQVYEFFYLSVSTEAVWIRSLTSLPLFTAFLKHCCNLSSVKGDSPLTKKKKDKQTVTEQQNNLMSPASPGRIHQILVTTPQTPTRIQTNADTGCVSREQNGWNELRIKLRWVGVRDMHNILVIQQTDLGEPCKTIVNMMGASRKWPYNNNTLFRFLKRTIFQTLTNHS